MVANARMIKSALWYRDQLGWSVIPHDLSSEERKPLVAWTPYKDKLPTDDEINLWWTKYPHAGLSVVTGKISGIVCLECDSQEAINMVEDMLPDSMVTPCVQSIRANGGRHYYFRSDDIIANKGRQYFKEKIELHGEGALMSLPPSKRNGKSYQWIIKPTCKEDFPLFSTINISNILKGGVIGGGITHNLSHDITNITEYNKLFQEGSRDNDLWHIGNQLKLSRTPEHEIAQVLYIIGKNCNPQMTEKQIDEKIISVLKRGEARESSLTNDIKGWIISHEGNFYITDISHDITQYNNIIEKKAINAIVHRLWKEGFIEKYGERRGCYRKLNHEIKRTRFIKEQIDDFPIILPFELNALCKLYAKNVVIIAGSKGAGKTAIALKIALDNQNMIPVRYMHSEGGDEEFSERMQNFGITDEKQIKFEPIKCAKNFHDYITDEKKIFIIDYIPVHKNFFEVAIPLQQIHDKLENGIAIVCLQKKSGALFGRGDEFSQEVSRLYLSMDFLRDERCTKITIVNAKAYKGDEDLTGWFRKIKISKKGTKLTPLETAWYKDFLKTVPSKKDWWKDD